MPERGADLLFNKEGWTIFLSEKRYTGSLVLPEVWLFFHAEGDRHVPVSKKSGHPCGIRILNMAESGIGP